MVFGVFGAFGGKKWWLGLFLPLAMSPGGGHFAPVSEGQLNRVRACAQTLKEVGFVLGVGGVLGVVFSFFPRGGSFFSRVFLGFLVMFVLGVLFLQIIVRFGTFLG